MAFQRPASAFRQVLGSEEFPFEDARYILYVALACPWANGVLQVARLRGLAPPLRPGAEPRGEEPLRVAVVHPTWQYTDPEADARKGEQALAAGVAASEPHAGWVFTAPGERLLPLAVLANGKAAFGLDLGSAYASAQEFCSRSLAASGPRAGSFAPDAVLVPNQEALREHGVASAFATPDPSRHRCKTLRHLYEKCGGELSAGARATTPMLLDSRADRVVSNESLDLAKCLNEWGNRRGAGGPDLYPAALRSEIDEMIEHVYVINNGVYRCGFANSQAAYDSAAAELEARMHEVDQHLSDGARAFLVGDQLTIADIRLFNTLVRMDEVYATYFKCYFVSLFAPSAGEAGASSRGHAAPKFPHLLRHTARLYNTFPEIRESVCMDEIRHHYFTSHAIRNMLAIVPREVGVLRRLESMRGEFVAAL